MTKIENIPAPVRENGLFCCWRYEERNGRKTKMPYNPRTGGRAQSNNPDTFAPLNVAAQAMGYYDGLGVGIFGSLGAIDIDHCLTDGELSPMAVDIIDTMYSYVEKSPMLKRLASTDTLRIEEKYRSPEDIIPSHSIVLFTNHLPRVGSTDGGTWRRLVVVPFQAAISQSGGVANFGEVLSKEAGPAILQWCIEGAVLFARNRYKLEFPEAVEEATEEYREREDWLSNFLSERCRRGANFRVGAAELYSQYKDWAASSGEYVRRLNDFNTAMENAGYHQIRPRNKRTWEGVELDHGFRFAQYPQAY